MTKRYYLPEMQELEQTFNDDLNILCAKKMAFIVLPNLLIQDAP